jgi:hypothetical protein
MDDRNWKELSTEGLLKLKADLEKKRDIWKGEYDTIKRQMDALKEKARGKDGEKGVSNPVIGAYGKSLQSINRGGYLRAQELLAALNEALPLRLECLRTKEEAEGIKQELEQVLASNPTLRDILMQDFEYPVAKGFDSESYVQQQGAQISQMKKALRANDLQVKEAQDIMTGLEGKTRALAGAYVTKLKAVSRSLKKQLAAMEPTAEGLAHDTQQAQIAVVTLRTHLDQVHNEVDYADTVVEESAAEAAKKTRWWKIFKFAWEDQP